ncbi:hypothetical protein FC25_GL000137 [Ligilactobacillus ruminis DSM 20403 = NBRC 102161]|uniref:Oligopeptide ABC superfamily ATP binding cassette transporter, binding protein n=1 Tax=Ligilactobacillus ruminis TaxID=1623 RepID=A0A837IR32_9LACO|nr:oligopeptide ABC superfamily ATP binding cassette transporter, binding protein [Ligilactobacillus ruminis]KRM83861.1 hypothetical protein FC25_GL000137 [Ligilactobacillus ruminis DSM 20403 = NBRC 102161]
MLRTFFYIFLEGIHKKKSNVLAIGATVLLLAGCGNGKSSDVSKKAGGKCAAKQ